MSLLLVVNQPGRDIYRYFGRASAVDDEVCERLEQKSAMVTAQKCVRQHVVVGKGGTPVELLTHSAPASGTAALRSVEEFHLSMLWGQLIMKPLDELQMQLGVQLLEDSHG